MCADLNSVSKYFITLVFASLWSRFADINPHSITDFKNSVCKYGIGARCKNLLFRRKKSSTVPGLSRRPCSRSSKQYVGAIKLFTIFNKPCTQPSSQANSSSGILPDLVQQLIRLYTSHKHSCYLYLGSILVDEFACEDGCVQGLLNMVKSFIAPTYCLL